MAKATLGVNWDHFIANYDDIREKIANVIPGFENFNERVRTPGGFALPHAVRDRREFATPSKKAQFTCHEIPKATLAAGQFVLMTIRTHDQFNTTIYGMNDRYRGIKQGRRIVMMNVEDMREQDLKDGDAVDVISHHKGITRRANSFRIVSYEIPRGSVAAYFPETNVLVPINQFAAGSQTPASKSVVVSFERVNG